MNLKYYQMIKDALDAVLQYDMLIFISAIIFLCSMGISFIVFLYYFWLFDAIESIPFQKKVIHLTREEMNKLIQSIERHATNNDMRCVEAKKET